MALLMPSIFSTTIHVSRAFTGLVSIYLNSMLASPSYEDGRLVSVDLRKNKTVHL